MTEQTPGCGSNSEGRKRAAEAALRERGPHAGCVPGTCKAGDQWRTVGCTDQGDAKALVWAIFNAVVKAAAPDDPTGHLPNCGYTDEGLECGCAEYGKRLHAALTDVLTARSQRPEGVTVTEALAQHREEWASYIENWDMAVGPRPPSVQGIVRALRGPVPFGVSAGDTEAGGGA